MIPVKKKENLEAESFSSIQFLITFMLHNWPSNMFCQELPPTSPNDLEACEAGCIQSKIVYPSSKCDVAIVFANQEPNKDDGYDVATLVTLLCFLAK